MNNLDEKRVLFSLTELVLMEVGISNDVMLDAKRDFERHCRVSGRVLNPMAFDDLRFFNSNTLSIESASIDSLLIAITKAFSLGWVHEFYGLVIQAGELYKLYKEHIEVGNLIVFKTTDSDYLINRNDYTEWYDNFWNQKESKPPIVINEDIQKLLDGTHEKQAPELKIAIETWIKAINKPVKNSLNTSTHIERLLPEGLSDRAIKRITSVVNWNKSGGR